MLYYDRIEDVNKTSASKMFIICNYWYFSDEISTGCL